MTKQNVILLAALLFLALVLVTPVSAVRTMSVNAGNGQSVTVGTALPVSPSVRITDDGAPVSGVRVTFTVTGGGGMLTGPVAVTNTNGVATVGSWRMGTQAGTNTLRATNGSLVTTFTATGTAGAASRIVKISGDGQTAFVGTAVAIPPGVRLLDVYQNPVRGRQVLFTVSIGGGTVLPATAIATNADGVATVTRWTLGPYPGTNSLIASSGVLSPVTFISAAVPSAAAPVITGIAPGGAVNTGSQTIDISGSGFSSPTVRLSRSGEPSITGAVAGSDTATRISRTFNLFGADPGTWNLVVQNPDGRSDSGLFVVRSATASVTAISPVSGRTNTTVSAIITGTGFLPSQARIRLYRGSNFISGTVNAGGTSTQVSGTFNLNQAATGTYEVCVLPDGTAAERVCGPLFTVYADHGSIQVRSTPSSGMVYLNNVFMGYTPITLEDISPGVYTVMVRSTGYVDRSETVRVSPGSIATVSAVLAPVTPTPGTTTPTTVVTTVTGPIPTTKASPLDPAIVIGTGCLVFIALRKR